MGLLRKNRRRFVAFDGLVGIRRRGRGAKEEDEGDGGEEEGLLGLMILLEWGGGRGAKEEEEYDGGGEHENLLDLLSFMSLLEGGGKKPKRRRTKE